MSPSIDHWNNYSLEWNHSNHTRRFTTRPHRVLILTLGSASSFVDGTGKATCGTIGFQCWTASTSFGVASAGGGMISRAAAGTISGTCTMSSSSSNVIDSGVAPSMFRISSINKLVFQFHIIWTRGMNFRNLPFAPAESFTIFDFHPKGLSDFETVSFFGFSILINRLFRLVSTGFECASWENCDFNRSSAIGSLVLVCLLNMIWDDERPRWPGVFWKSNNAK